MIRLVEKVDHPGWAESYSRRALLVVVRILKLVVLIFALLGSGTAAARPDVASLVQKLKSGEDFRVRVQAALELGKSKESAVRDPLEGALDDENAAVRAAAAAALKALGDRRALPALRKHASDSSSAVRSQIKSSIQALEAGAGAPAGKPRVLVKLGKMKNGSGVRSSELVGALEQKSRSKLGELPGVRVLRDSEDVNAEAKKKKLPAVMMTGRIRRLKASRDGDHVVYSASVEYVMHRMPDQSLMGTMSGSASARASPEEARSKVRSAELRSAVLEAAISSAMRRAPEALAAAAR